MRATLLIASSLLLLAAVPALAAEPESGSVSPSAPTTEWSGTSGGYGINIVNVGLGAAGEPMICEAPFCDTYALDVAEGGLSLAISVTSTDSSITILEVHKPDGSFSRADGIEPEGADPDYTTTLKFKKPEKGAWTVKIQSNAPGGTDPYTGIAQMTVPEPPPAEAPLAPGGETPAQQQPPASTAPTLSIGAMKVKARKVNRRRRLKLTLESTGPVRSLSAVLKRGSKVVGKGRRASLEGRGTITLKLSRRLKPGRYNVRVVGKTDSGSTLNAGAPLRVAR